MAADDPCSPFSLFALLIIIISTFQFENSFCPFMMPPKTRSSEKKRMHSPSSPASSESESSDFPASPLELSAEAVHLPGFALESGSIAPEAGASHAIQDFYSYESSEGVIRKRVRLDLESQQTPTRDPAAPVPSISSPIRVSGSHIDVSMAFEISKGTHSQEFCKVDKTLVCRGFWNCILSVGRLHLPRRFGKTYNLGIMRSFFSASPESSAVEHISVDDIEEDVTGLSIAEVCWKKREWLFRDSMLRKEDPVFFEQHFGKYPVIFLSFSICKSSSLVAFLRQLCDVIIRAYNNWLSDFKNSMELSEDACEAKLALDDQIREYKKSRRDPEYILGNIDMAQVIFEDLSMLTMHHFGRCYILLADEYDVPFITVHQSHWSTAQQQDAISTLQSLFGFMFKDNMSLEKGLMVGVIPVSLSDLGSGVNNFSDVTTVPTEQNDLDLIALLGPPEYPLSSIDELVNSFGFDYSEIRYIAQIVFTPYSYLRNQIDDVMQSIRQWYNGYQLYRFGGKYNPWSVCFCLKHMVQRISGNEGFSGESVSKLINLSTKNYWDRTGSPGLIQRQMELHPDEFCELANVLFKEFAEHSNRDPFADAPSETAVELPWSDFRLSDLAIEDFNQSAFLNLALYSGYLTVRSSATVGIPNGELQHVWDAILRQMLLHSVPSNRSLLKKGKLLTELHNGKTDYLCQLLKGSCAILANHKSHKEFEYANIAVATINCAARFGVFTHPSQTDCSPFDYTISRESAAGQGNIDWVTLLHSTKNKRNAFGMLVEFKHIPDDKIKSNRVGYGKAKKGLQQIKDKYYSLSMDRCVECIHIGISIGRGAVHAVSQLYMRDSTEEEWIETDSLV